MSLFADSFENISPFSPSPALATQGHRGSWATTVCPSGGEVTQTQNSFGLQETVGIQSLEVQNKCVLLMYTCKGCACFTIKVCLPTAGKEPSFILKQILRNIWSPHQFSWDGTTLAFIYYLQVTLVVLD